MNILANAFMVIAYDWSTWSRSSGRVAMCEISVKQFSCARILALSDSASNTSFSLYQQMPKPKRGKTKAVAKADNSAAARPASAPAAAPVNVSDYSTLF